MTRPSDIPEDIYERADILCDQFRDISDDRELIARVLMAVGQGATVGAGLTHEQAKALDFIRTFQIENSGASPSYAEIGEAVGRSKGNVHDLLHRMKDRGVIAIPRHRARSITIVARA